MGMQFFQVYHVFVGGQEVRPDSTHFIPPTFIETFRVSDLNATVRVELENKGVQGFLVVPLFGHKTLTARDISRVRPAPTFGDFLPEEVLDFSAGSTITLKEFHLPGVRLPLTQVNFQVPDRSEGYLALVYFLPGSKERDAPVLLQVSIFFDPDARE